MKKVSIFILLFILHKAGYSQILKGTVLDQSNGSKIEFATVYINGTSAGTYSDKEGYFELDISRFSSMPVTISALGYYSITVYDFPRDKLFSTYLSPKIFELNEVVINSRKIDRERRAVLRIFRQEFIGTTDNADDCIIVNENDIRFSYSSDNDTLKVFALKPL